MVCSPWRVVLVGPRTLIHRPLRLVRTPMSPKQATLATRTNNNAFQPQEISPLPPNNKKTTIFFSKILPLNVGDRSELAPFTLFKIYDVKPWCHLLAENKGKVVTQISAQRSSKQGGEGGRGGRGNPPSRGAQVGFEQINQSRSREDVLSAPKYSPAVLFRSYPITGRRPSRGTQPCPPSRTSPPPSRWRPSRTAWTACRWGAWSTKKAPVSTAWHRRQKEHDLGQEWDQKQPLNKKNPILDPDDHKPFEPALQSLQGKALVLLLTRIIPLSGLILTLILNSIRMIMFDPIWGHTVRITRELNDGLLKINWYNR